MNTVIHGESTTATITTGSTTKPALERQKITDGAAHVSVKGTASVNQVVDAVYYTGTLDTAATNSVTIPDTIGYKEAIFKFAGLPTGVTVDVTGDVSETQAGTYSVAMGLQSIAVARSNTTVTTSSANGTFVRDWGFVFTALKLTISGTPAAGTLTYHVILRK